MLKQTLQSAFPLKGYNRTFADIKLFEVTNAALVSIAFSLNDTSALQDTFAKAYGISLPDYGSSSLSKDGAFRFMSMQPGLIFALYEFEGATPIRMLADQLGYCAYFSDQSDSWVILRLSGPTILTVLERVCPLDLSPEIFSPGSVARTKMEHLSTVILRENFDDFSFMSPRSSACSFLHTLETSIENTL